MSTTTTGRSYKRTLLSSSNSQLGGRNHLHNIEALIAAFPCMIIFTTIENLRLLGLDVLTAKSIRGAVRVKNYEMTTFLISEHSAPLDLNSN